MGEVNFKIALMACAFAIGSVAVSAYGQALPCKESLATRGVAIPNVTTASPLSANASTGVFFTSQEINFWRHRATSGPFVHNNDFTQGSPGDWDRIKARAEAFVAKVKDFTEVAQPATAVVPAVKVVSVPTGCARLALAASASSAAIHGAFVVRFAFMMCSCLKRSYCLL